MLEDGRVAARGTHDELLEESDLYREIAEKGLPDQDFLTPATPRRARGGGPVSARAELVAILRGERGRTRKLRAAARAAASVPRRASC